MFVQKVSPVIKYCCIIIAAGLLIYTGYRSYNLSFTHDESLSYNYIVHNSFMGIVSNNISYISANNHILNTLSMKLFEFLFGNSELALRLQSLIAHVLYLLFTFLLLKDIKNSAIVLCGYILLNVNPYLLDFFSLARGYGLAISFMMISIYYFFDFIKHSQQKKLIISLVAACSSVLSNFALFNYLAALIIVYELYLVYTYNPLKINYKTILNKNKIILLLLIIMSAICYEPISILKKNNQFYYGGDTGFWHDTAGSLIHTFLYGQNYENKIFAFIQIAAAIIPLGFLIIQGYKWVTKKPVETDVRGLRFILLLALIIISGIVQNLLMGTKFLEDRLALFIVPVFIFVLLFFFQIINFS